MNKNNGLKNSFKNAFAGVTDSLKSERNMRIHVAFVLIVIVFGILFKINAIEWIVCFVFFGGVIAFELINTSIEAAIDICSPEKSPAAKKAKDTAAAAVLIWAILSVLAGCIIFIPKIIRFILSLFS